MPRIKFSEERPDVPVDDDLFAKVAARVPSPEWAAAVFKAEGDPAYADRLLKAAQQGRAPQEVMAAYAWLTQQLGSEALPATTPTPTPTVVPVPAALPFRFSAARSGQSPQPTLSGLLGVSRAPSPLFPRVRS